ncbi:MAG: hypothetical protein WD187_00680 [Candidatus Woykebacteria bacterium]
MPQQKFITIDIGSAWTKAFLAGLDSENNISIEGSARLPTSSGNFSFATSLLLKKIGQEEAPKIFVSSISQVEDVAKKYKAAFVAEEEAATALVKFIKKGDASVSVLDAGASNLHESIHAGDVGKYLTFGSSEIFLENFFGKKRFKPHLLPIDTKELEIEEAFLRHVFISKLSNQNTSKKMLIIATGGMISGAPRLSRIALLILDVLGPGVVAQVVYDREFFLPSFGALLAKYKQFEMATPVGWLDDLGAFVSLGGTKRLELDWGYSQMQQIELEDGEISLIPAPKEQKIEMSILGDKKEKKKYSVNGGSLGVVLDARQKPLPLDFGHSESRRLMSSWLKELEQAEINKEAF